MRQGKVKKGPGSQGSGEALTLILHILNMRYFLNI